MLKIQKAKHLYLEMEAVRPKCIGQVYYLLEKYDGWYGYIDLYQGFEGVIKSRAGRDIPSMTDFGRDLVNMLPNIDGRLIFEIMIPNMEFAELNGVLNRKFAQASDAYIVVHDFIPEAGDLDFEDRFGLVESIVRQCNVPTVRKARLLGISSTVAHWHDACKEVWAEGGEGLILKRAKAMYGNAVRNYDLMKIKEEITLDLLVAGAEEGLGKYAGTLGSLILVDKSGLYHKVSGMTDTERSEWWKDGSQIIGKVVEVRAMKILPDGQLREPRFKAIRFDKTSTEID